MTRTIKIIAAVLLLAGTAGAQEEISLDQAVQIAIENNHQLKVSRNAVQIAENTAIPGQAGLLPTVSAQGSVNYGLNNTGVQVVGQPDPIEATGAESINLSAGVQASYTVFSGFTNKNTLEQLKINADLSRAQNRLSIESTIMQVYSAYFNVLRAEENLRTLNESRDISDERLHISETRQNLSGGSRLNVLSAKVDLNKDSVNILNATYAVENARIRFNQLLGRDPKDPVELSDNPEANPPADFSVLEQKAIQQNSQMLIVKYNEQVSMLDYQIAKGAYMPEVNVQLGYNYNYSEQEGSFLEYQRSNGLSGALTLSIPIYTGGRRKARVKNTEIGIENAQIQRSEAELGIKADLTTAYRNYEIVKSIYDMELRNLETVRENLEYVKNRFELGLVTGIQYREAQLNLLRTESNIVSVRYDLRLAELELLRVTGQLVQ